MKTYFLTLGILELIWFTILFLFCCWGFYMEYKFDKQRKRKVDFIYNFKKIFGDSDLISAYFVGAFFAFVLSIPATWFVFIFKLGDKLLDKL